MIKAFYNHSDHSNFIIDICFEYSRSIILHIGKKENWRRREWIEKGWIRPLFWLTLAWHRFDQIRKHLENDLQLMLLFACKVSSKILNDIPWQCPSVNNLSVSILIIWAMNNFWNNSLRHKLVSLHSIICKSFFKRKYMLKRPNSTHWY